MTPEEQLRITNENLYKHSHELAVKNKVLSFLGKLYEISVLTLNQKTLAEQVAFAIQAEFDFEIVGIFIYDKSTNSLTPLTIAVSERVHALMPVDFAQNGFGNIAKNQFLNMIVTKRAMHYSELLESIWSKAEYKDFTRNVENEKFVRSSLGYPLIIGDEVIGVAIVSLNRTYGDLIEYERDSIKSFMNLISIAINRVMLYEQLAIANQKQESLLHFITHEVKGYLTKNKAVFASVVEGDFKDMPQIFTDLAKRALEDTDKGVATVRDLLDSSNLKKGTTEYQMESFDFKVLVEEAVVGFTQQAISRGLSLSLDVAPGIYTCVGDHAKLERHVIRNLIDNSLKYTQEGSVSVSLSISDDCVHFCIKDTGVGIDPSDRSHLFTEGGKGKDSMKINVESTGYGLFIAKVVVEAHRGKIWVESDGKDTGSSFFVDIPTH